MSLQRAVLGAVDVFRIAEAQRYRHGWIPIADLRKQPTPELDKAIASMRDMPDDEFHARYLSLKAAPASDGNRLALVKLAAELQRRRRVAKRSEAAEARQRQVDRLVADGVPELDAYTDVFGAAVTRQQVDALIDRRPGETRAKAMRRAYTERVALEVDRAEDDTNGNLLSAAGRAAGVHAATLWSAAPAVARRRASPELLEWWSEHGGRLTFAEFRGQIEGGAARRAAQASRSSGAARDYGV